MEGHIRRLAGSFMMKGSTLGGAIGSTCHGWGVSGQGASGIKFYLEQWFSPWLLRRTIQGNQSFKKNLLLFHKLVYLVGGAAYTLPNMISNIQSSFFFQKKNCAPTGTHSNITVKTDEENGALQNAKILFYRRQGLRIIYLLTQGHFQFMLSIKGQW